MPETQILEGAAYLQRLKPAEMVMPAPGQYAVGP